MTPSDYATFRALIRSDEGLRLSPYIDTRGNVTIGWGRNLTAHGISRDEAVILNENDLTTAVSDLQRAFPLVMQLDSVRWIVLACMAYNLGVGELSKFTQMWAAIRASDWATAALEMLQSSWAEQVGARATRLAEAMRTGQFQETT
jgi:lysozyme